MNATQAREDGENVLIADMIYFAFGFSVVIGS